MYSPMEYLEGEGATDSVNRAQRGQANPGNALAADDDDAGQHDRHDLGGLEHHAGGVRQEFQGPAAREGSGGEWGCVGWH